MVNKRLVRKILSTLSAIVISVTTINSIPFSQIVKASEDNNDYINEKYLTETDEKNIGGAIAYGDGLILISNIKSYSQSGMLDDTYNLTEDTELKFVDINGNNHTISNKDENGNKKYDSIYGTLTDAYYTYLIVGKDGKASLIDDDGNKVQVGNNLEYDKIGLYRDGNGKIIYKLINYCYDDKNLFDIELVGEDGNIIFNLEKCKDFYCYKQFSNTSTDSLRDNYFIAMTGNDNKGYLINSDGEILYETQADYVSFDSYLNYGCFRYNGIYTYYNLNNGKVINSHKQLYRNNTSNQFGLYYTLTDEAYVGYDIDFNEVKIIPGAYQKVQLIWQKLMLTDLNGMSNIYDIDGNLFFEQDVKVENSSYPKSGLLIKDSNNQEIIIYDNGNKRISLNEIRTVADNKLSEMNYDIANIKQCAYKMKYYGIDFTYTFADETEKVTISISYESDYKELFSSNQNDENNRIEDDSRYIVNDNEIVKRISDKCYHIFELIDKDILDEYGSSRACKYRLLRSYYMDNGNLKIKVPNTNYYTDSISTTNRTVYLYNEDGILYGLDEQGEIVDKYLERVRSFTFGDSGMEGLYCNIRLKGSVIAGKITVTDKKGRVIYNEEAYSLHKPFRGFLNYGYMNILGKKIISYDGEVVVESLQIFDTYQNNGLAYVLINGKLYKLKNLLVNKLEDIISSETGINIIHADDESRTKLLTGIEDNKLVGDIKNTLNNTNVKIVDKDGNELSDTEKLGTGFKVQLFIGNEVTDSAVAVIKGDVDGTGTIDVLDMEAIQKSILGIGDKLSGAYKEAASLSGGEDITVLDMEVIQKDILGIQKIN